MNIPVKKIVTVYDLTTTIKCCPYCGCHSSFTKITKADNDTLFEYRCTMCDATMFGTSLEEIIEKLKTSGYFKCDEWNEMHLCNYNYESFLEHD